MDRHNNEIQDPKFIRALWDDHSLAWIWLIFRLYLAYTWMMAGWLKLNNSAWMDTGLALKGFWTNAVKITDPAHPVVAYDWYRAFLQFLLDGGSYVWFAKFVAIGEFLVGVALLLGILTGVFAFFAGFMNWNYIMAGAASTNGMLLILAVLLVAAWKTAGWWGLDRWILPWLLRSLPARANVSNK
jgi:thiosulfate dehydrogenase (quinone) large subunit